LVSILGGGSKNMKALEGPKKLYPIILVAQCLALIMHIFTTIILRKFQLISEKITFMIFLAKKLKKIFKKMI
jgi:hypothetical protein